MGFFCMSKRFFSLVVYLRMISLFLLKIMSHSFYRTRQRWISKDKDWDDVKLVVLLNHTSLFEFVYASVMPFSYLKKMSKHLVFPVADITYKRKFFGNLTFPSFQGNYLHTTFFYNTAFFCCLCLEVLPPYEGKS